MNQKPVVLVTRKLPGDVEARIAQEYEAIFNPDDRLYTPSELIELSQKVDAIIPCHTEKFTAEVIEQLSDNVKIIANFSVGVDHCDLEAAKGKGIVVTNTPDVLSDATAEIAILLMLGAARLAPKGLNLVLDKEWNDWSPSFMVGRQVTGKRFGVLGMGRVGQIAARRAQGFDMKIHYHNRRPVEDASFADAVWHESLDDLLPQCDVLSIHCPSTPETAGLLSAEKLALLPDGAIVINTARGAIVDDEALIAAAASGKIWAIGLDVYNGEPSDIHPGYRTLENAFLLPHIGSATTDTRNAMGFRALDNLAAFFAGKEPGDRVA